MLEKKIFNKFSWPFCIFKNRIFTSKETQKKYILEFKFVQKDRLH